MKRWQTPRKKPKKPPFGQRPMPRGHHPRERVRKRHAAYVRRIIRRVEIMWAGWHDRGFIRQSYMGTYTGTSLSILTNGRSDIR